MLIKLVFTQVFLFSTLFFFHALAAQVSDTILCDTKVANKKGEVPQSLRGGCHTVSTKDDLDLLVNNLRQHKQWVLNIEATGPLALHDICTGFAFAYDEDQVFYVPFGHMDQQSEQQLSKSMVLRTLKPLFEDESIAKVLYDTTFSTLLLEREGISLAGIYFDVMLAANLFRKPRQQISLEELSKYYLNEQVAPSIALAALQIHRLHHIFQEQLHQQHAMQDYFETIEMPLVGVLTAMRRKGLLVDVVVFESVERGIVDGLKKIEHKVDALLPDKTKKRNPHLDLDSLVQIEQLLVDDLGLPAVQTNNLGERSLNQKVLKELRAKYPIIDLILQHRHLTMLRRTYLQPLMHAINSGTGRIHTSYNQNFVLASRLDPCFQHIPAGTAYGIAMRSAFVATPGSYLLAADYSQCGLHIVANLSEDESLKKMLVRGEDLHQQAAGYLFDVEEDVITPLQRQIGKRINCALIVGVSIYGIARKLDIPAALVQEYRDHFFERYSQVAAWIDNVVAQAEERGYVTSWKGWRHLVPELQDNMREKHMSFSTIGGMSTYELSRKLGISMVIAQAYIDQIFERYPQITSWIGQASTRTEGADNRMNEKGRSDLIEGLRKRKEKQQHALVRHFAINKLIEGTTADIMKIAMINIHKRFVREGLASRIIVEIHDELIFEVPAAELNIAETIIKEEMEGVVTWEAPLKVAIRKGTNWGEITK